MPRTPFNFATILALVLVPLDTLKSDGKVLCVKLTLRTRLEDMHPKADLMTLWFTRFDLHSYGIAPVDLKVPH